MQRAPVVEAVLDEARDLPRRGGIVTAVEPHLAISDSGPGARCCSRAGQSAQPIAALSAEAGTSQRVLVAQHRDRERGIHRLVAAGQPRQRQVELAAPSR